jgi:hypothetical protein
MADVAMVEVGACVDVGRFPGDMGCDRYVVIYSITPA